MVGKGTLDYIIKNNEISLNKIDYNDLILLCKDTGVFDKNSSVHIFYDYNIHVQ